MSEYLHDRHFLADGAAVAHRGFHDLNKKVLGKHAVGLRRAVDKKYAIECDVRLSATAFRSSSTMATSSGWPAGRASSGSGPPRDARHSRSAAPRPRADLKEVLDLVDGRVPMVVELKGTPGHDAGLVESVVRDAPHLPGKAAIMSFDHG